MIASNSDLYNRDKHYVRNMIKLQDFDQEKYFENQKLSYQNKKHPKSKTILKPI